MTGTPKDPSDRLDSWKAIAAYLQRDERTARRWGGQQGLPVRRVPGGRRGSVFAFQSEIDAWLASGQATAPPASASWRPRLPALVAIAVVAVIAALAWRTWPHGPADAGLRLEAVTDGVAAIDGTGAERWRHRFPATHTTILADGDGEPVQLVGGADPAAYIATSFRQRRADGLIEGGELASLDLDGSARQRFSFDDQVTFDQKPFGPPWALTAFAVDDATGSRRIAVAAHHYAWSPSLLTLLDERWQRRGTFSHAGWIEAVRWLRPDRLLIGGFSETRDGGMVALLDPADLGRGPLRMIVMPRTELNRVTVSRFNRAIVQVLPDRIVARPIEVPSAGEDAVDALYEFTPGLEFMSASFSARYWEVHRALEAQGKLDHPRERCPDRLGPREIQVWTPDQQWTPLPINR